MGRTGSRGESRASANLSLRDVGPVSHASFNAGRTAGLAARCMQLSYTYTIPGHRAGPARPGPVMGRHGTMAIGPRRHAVPYGPCLIGLRAWPSAQARACGPSFVPCWPVRHGKNNRPCQPTAR